MSETGRFLSLQDRLKGKTLGIKTKLALAISILIALICLFIFVYFPYKLEHQALGSISERAISVSQIAAFSMSPALLFNDPRGGDEALGGVRKDPEVAYIMVLDKDGSVFNSYQQSTARAKSYINTEPNISNDGLTYKVSAPIEGPNGRLGRLYLGISLNELKTEVTRSRENAAWLSFMILLAGVLAVVAISTVITGPLREMVSIVQKIAGGDLSQRARISSGDEVGHLAKSFNLMVDHLERVYNELEVGNRNLETRVEERTSQLQIEIDHHKETERQLQNAKEASETANYAKSQFLAKVSHELRTPMNGIMGMTDIVLDTRLEEEQRDCLNTVRASADSLLILLNDLLDFSKIEAGKLELDCVEFQIREILADTVKPLAMQANEKEVELILDVASDVPATLMGDPTRVRQIIVNLVGNAVKFTERGEVHVSVAIKGITPQEACLHFSVADTGIGIPIEKQEIIFQAFTQADNSTTRKYGGTGLGLSISSQLVGMMGGAIWVESDLNKGSVFHFTAIFGMPMVVPETGILSVKKDLADIRCLVVDDNATNRRILEEMLSQWGMKPTLVDGAESAWKELENSIRNGLGFELILLDAQMPLTDGFTLAERIKTLQLPQTIIMMLSSGSPSEDLEKCRHLGISRHLRKPISQSDLLDAVLRILEPTHTAGDKGSPMPDSEPHSEKRILLVEDNRTNQRIARKILEKEGHSVQVAGNGKEALAVLGNHTFDLILMDVQMAEMDGLEATRIIRSKGMIIPIIAMTAHAMKGDRERCLDAGMDDYITKPIRRKELFDAIAKVVGAKEIAEQVSCNKGSVDQDAILVPVEGDMEFYEEIVPLFLEDSTDLMSQIQTAISRAESGSLLKAIHTLKGSIGNFRAASALEAVVRLETIARSGSLVQAQNAYLKLEIELERLIVRLLALVKEKVS